jgi:hypothetical protein
MVPKYEYKLFMATSWWALQMFVFKIRIFLDGHRVLNLLNPLLSYSFYLKYVIYRSKSVVRVLVSRCRAQKTLLNELWNIVELNKKRC